MIRIKGILHEPQYAFYMSPNMYFTWAPICILHEPQYAFYMSPNMHFTFAQYAFYMSPNMHFTWAQICIFDYLVEFFVEWEMFQTTFVGKIKTRFQFNKFLVSKIVSFLK